MISLDQFFSALAGAFLFWIGIKAILDREITFSKETDEDDAPSVHIRGWFAVVIGGLSIMGAGYFFAGAVGWIHIEWT